MKAEHKDMLAEVIELFLFWGANEKGFDFSVEESDHRLHMFEKLIESGDPEVLRRLIGMLAMKVGGGMSYMRYSQIKYSIIIPMSR